METKDPNKPEDKKPTEPVKESNPAYIQKLLNTPANGIAPSEWDSLMAIYGGGQEQK